MIVLISIVTGIYMLSLDILGASLVAQRLKRPPAMQETWVRSLGREDSLEKEMATHPVFLPGKSHGQRSLVDCSPWGRKESEATDHTCTAI